MDIISHGLWGAISFGRKNRQLFWEAFCFGIAPDFLSFGIFFFLVFLGVSNWPQFPSGHFEGSDTLPLYVHTLYDWTHSFLIFGVLFVVLWLWFRRPIWTALAWPLHILVDIFTHGTGFFPTPFLWPLSDFHINGIPWSRPVIFVPNIVLLGSTYGWFFIVRPRLRKKSLGQSN